MGASTKTDQEVKDTLSTLDLHEKPGQRITVFTKVRHGLEDQRVDVQPGEQIFSPGPHHGYYGYVHAKEEPPCEETRPARPGEASNG